jgi:hypothetical protein
MSLCEVRPCGSSWHFEQFLGDETGRWIHSKRKFAEGRSAAVLDDS